MATGRKLGLPGTYPKAAFSQADRDEIEAAIPDGTRIVVTANHRHGPFTLRGWRDDEKVLTYEAFDPVQGARVMAKELAVEGMTVTVDADGYIRDIEVDRHG